MSERGSRHVRLKDVAERVGITSAAASMALSGHPRISEATVERVRAAAAELGYVPSSAAQALRRQRSGAISLIVPNSAKHVFGHSYFMHVLTGVSTAANQRDVQVLISTSANEASGLTAYERVMRSRTVDGAIVTSAAAGDTNIERLAASGLPLVLIGNYPELPSASSVGIDDVQASRLITEHLIEVHGRRSLLHVAGPLNHQTAVDRREGFWQAVRHHGLKRRSAVIEGNFSEQSGFTALDQAGRSFDGIVFANDDMAFGGLQHLRREARTVPDHVSVVGFDDFGLSRIAHPSITTVHVPAEDMARTAAERLFALIDNPSAEPTRDELEVSLVVRESCGCAQTEITLLHE